MQITNDTPVSASMSLTGEEVQSSDPRTNQTAVSTDQTGTHMENSTENTHTNHDQDTHLEIDNSTQPQLSKQTIDQNTESTCNVLDKDKYTFNLFIKAVNDKTTSTILAKSIDNRVYRYHYDENRLGPVCVLLESLSREALEDTMTICILKNILDIEEPPWKDYLISLHEFANTGSTMV